MRKVKQDAVEIDMIGVDGDVIECLRLRLCLFITRGLAMLSQLKRRSRLKLGEDTAGKDEIITSQTTESGG